MITYTAYITTEADGQAGDPGLTVQVSDEEDGQSHYQGDAARIDDPGYPLADEYGDLDTDAAERLLAQAGFQVAGAWRESGGQYGTPVEPRPDARWTANVGPANAAWLASQDFLQGNDWSIRDNGDGTVTFDSRLHGHMRNLPGEHDGHVDDREVLWIAGGGYPVRPVA